MARAFWFAVGTGAGVYGTVKARRLAYRLSPGGLADQASALGLGLRTLAADVRCGLVEREEELLERLRLATEAEQAGRAGRALGGVGRPTGPAPALAAPSHPVRRDIP